MIRPRSAERSLRIALLMAGDALIGWASLAAAVFLRRNFDFAFTRTFLPAEKFALTATDVLVVCAALVIALALNGFYNPRVSKRHRPILGAALIMQGAMVAIAATFQERLYPRSFLLLVPLFEILALPLWRRAFAHLLPVRPRDTVLVGEAQDFPPFLQLLGEGLDARIRVTGLVTPRPPENLSNGWLAYWGDLTDPEVQRRIRGADELVYISHQGAPELRLRLLEIRGPRGFLFVPGQADALLTPATFGWIGDQPLLEISARCAYGAGAVAKRAMDLFIGGLLFIVSLPLWAIIASIVFLESGRPVLLHQLRVGKDGREFGMWKFRTMLRAPHREDDLALVREGDRRVTRMGWWLRRHRLDELPQLLNVLKGDMSLVGPRPERRELVDAFSKTLPEFRLRLLVKPGIAGLAQVWSEYDTNAPTKLRYDLTYICAWAIGLDLRILLRAVSTALAGRGL